MKRRDFNKVLGALGVSLVAGARAMAQDKKADDKTPKHVCKGFNECKGQGGCATGEGGAAGKNSCKGKGGCATTPHHECRGKNDCKGQGGCGTKASGCQGKNECKGKGACKGQGFVKMTAEDCKAKGGKVAKS